MRVSDLLFIAAAADTVREEVNRTEASRVSVRGKSTTDGSTSDDGVAL